jgi:hypothetical protein
LIEDQVNKELFLGTNGLPDPRFCNTILAVMRALHTSGAADVLDELRKYDEPSRVGGSGMDISDACDNLFVVKLHDVSLSRVTGNG